MASSADYLLTHLSENHKNQIQTFLKFSRTKRDETLKEIQAEFQDVKELRVVEDVYSGDDARSLIDNISQSIKASVQKELEQYSHANTLFLRHLFLQAEGHGVDSLKVDPNVVHDESLMSAVSKKSDKLSELPSLAAAPKLAPIQGAVDVTLVAKVKDLEEANQRSQDRFGKLQQQYLELQKKQSELRAQLEEAQASQRASQAALAAAMDASQQQQQAALAAQSQSQSQQASSVAVSAAAAMEIAALKAQIGELQKEVATRVAQTKQFQDLKKMVMQKNQQIKEIRTRLDKYEPSSSSSSSASVDDDNSSDDE